MEQPLSRWLSVSDPLAWGTTAASRQRQAPDPEAVPLDSRGEAEQIRFVQALARQVRFTALSGADGAGVTPAAFATWQAFCEHGELPPETMAAFAAGEAAPEAFSQAQRDWLGRPHFALLLVFIRLLRHQRQLLNALPARHLHHVYRDQLGFAPRPGEPDRVTVAFTLTEDSPPLLLPAGAVLRAGVDERGRDRLYRTLTELSLNHARVCGLRTVQVECGLTTLASLQVEEPLPSHRLERMLRLAYGEGWGGVEDLCGLLPLLRFCAIDGRADHLPLELHEFLRLMRLVRQRSDAGAEREWAAINRWLGLDELFAARVLTDPRDFVRNVSASLLGPEGGLLDWKADGVSELNSIDDLYNHRDDEAVKPVLRRLLTAPTCRMRHALPPSQASDSEALLAARLATFVRLMTMKLHIDAQWQQVNWLLERCGKRRRQLPSWRLDADQPNSTSPAFADQLAKAWGINDARAIPWPVSPLSAASPAGPAAVPAACWRYFIALEALEQRHGLPLEDLARLCALAERVAKGQATAESWTCLQELLQAASEERWAAARRAALDQARAGQEDEEAFARLLRQALREARAAAATRSALTPPDGTPAEPVPLSWTDALEGLAPWLPGGAGESLRRFGEALRSPGTDPRRLSWAQVVGLLEEAQRAASGARPPALVRLEWRQLRGCQREIDPEALAAGEPLEPCFWRGESGGSDPADPGAGIGFGVASRLLALSEGSRRIALTLRVESASGTPEALLASLRAPAGQRLQAADCAGEPPLSPEREGWGLNQALLVEVSTAEGWLERPLARARLLPAPDSGPPVWELALELALTPSDPPLAPLATGELPRLRLRLRPWREEGGSDRGWRSCGGLDGLRLRGARLRVEARGLQRVRLQQEGAAVDPREPFAPFGSNPVVGRCLYISHPELIDGELEEIRFSGRWQQLPPDLTAHYRAYRGWAGLAPDAAVTRRSFRVDVSLRQRNVGALREMRDQPLLTEAGDALLIRCSPPPGPVAAAPVAPPLGDAGEAEDLREQERVWCWRLTPTDFGHGLYPALVVRKAQELAVAISGAAGRQALALAEAMGADQGSLSQRYDAALQAAGATPIHPEDYAVPEPWTPLLAGLEVSYSRVQEFGEGTAEQGQLLRVHLFGEEEPVDLPPPLPAGSEESPVEAPPLLPGHPHPGELWLELEGTRPNQPLALAFQLAEGTAKGARPVQAVRWEVRQGWRWQPLPLREDGTNGLLHSGILRFSLPDAVAERQWIRACLLAPVEAYATLLAIQSQAVEAEAIPPVAEEEAEERETEEEASGGGASAAGVAPVPLPPHSIKDLEEGVPGIGAIHQPFSSRSGRAVETEAELRLRAAERLRHKDRALAAWDYERLLWEGFASQLHAVACLPARERRGVEVVVIPNLREQVPRNLFAPGAPTDRLAAMERHLRQRCPEEVALVVRNATYLHVMARLWVCLREGVDPVHAEGELRQAVVRALSPWCFDANAEVRLGGEVRASDLAVAIDALPFVAYLERLRLFLVDPGGKPLRLDGVEGSSEELLRAPAADVVLIAAPSHAIEFVSAATPVSSLIGIGAMRIDLDFQVA
ncbi:MAG: hypothetical protein VKO39_13465 [Cyanobacteriota bacterium]|nr:hypothetical protein [Cyanobacteriota bacterium]